jgi:hypothetical protein
VQLRLTADARSLGAHQQGRFRRIVDRENVDGSLIIIRTVTVLILAFATVNSAVWSSERHPKAPSEIEALERAWSTAFLKHDTATIASILADDFVGIDGRGVVSDKSHEIEEAKAPAAGSPPGTYVILSETLSGVRVRLSTTSRGALAARD